MELQNYKFIPTRGKQPRFSNPYQNLVDYEEAQKYESYGLVIPEGMICLDFDDMVNGLKALNIIRSTGVKATVYKTTRGYHVWFKLNNKSYKNVTNVKLACGLTCDLRVGGKQGYAILKLDGVEREQVISHDVEDLLPAFFKPLSGSKDYGLLDMGVGCGRNMVLYKYIMTLQRNKLSDEEIKETLHLINNFVFSSPLSDDEMAKIQRDDAFKKRSEIEMKEKFNHAVFCDELLEENKIVFDGGNFYMYQNGYYANAEHDLPMLLIHAKHDITIKQRAECLKYMEIICHSEYLRIKNNKDDSINVNNGRLNIKTGELVEHSPEFFDTVRVPITYNPFCYENSAVDKLLNDVFSNDEDLIKLFYEIVATCLLKNNPFQKAFIFYGGGGNGKSTILNLIRAVVGGENASHLTLNDLSTSKFRTAILVDKLVNLGDDLSDITMKDSGLLKSIFAGEEITVEEKHKKPYSTVLPTTCIFACNRLPRNNDTSEGMNRRWVMLPFNNCFTDSREKLKINILDDCITDNAISYIINQAIEAYARMLANNGYTEGESTTKIKKDYVVENDTVAGWIDDESIKVDDVTGIAKKAVYKMYRDWCSDVGYSPRGAYKFYADLENHLRIVKAKIKGANVWVPRE